MDNVANWTGMTQSHGFQVKVGHETETNTFIARISISSPPLAPILKPGGQIQMMQFDDPEEIEHTDIDKLRVMTKQKIVNQCGKILQLFEE